MIKLDKDDDVPSVQELDGVGVVEKTPSLSLCPCLTLSQEIAFTESNDEKILEIGGEILKQTINNSYPTF